MKTNKLFVNPLLLKKLNSDIWSEENIDVSLITNGNKYKIKLSYRGHLTREYKKKSYNILFIKPWYKDQAHEIHLNAEYKDPSLMRNRLSMNFFNSIDVLAPETEHVLLYINDVFKGVYLQLESFDGDYLKKRNLPLGPIFYAINNWANFSLITPEGDVKPSLDEGYMRKIGSDQDNEYLSELMIVINTLDDNEFAKEIGQILNVEKYLKWLAGAVCTQNFDGFVHNYALYLNSETGLFEISPWDYDGTWGRDISGHSLKYDYVPIQGYNTLTARILNCKQYRQKYKQILSHILENQFTVEHQLPIIENIFEEIKPYIIKYPETVRKASVFLQEPEFIIKFIKERNSYLKEQLKLLD